MMSKSHHFFLLPVSPWALVNSILSLNLALSLLIFFKFNSGGWFLLSILYLSWGASLWWATYTNEMNTNGMVSFVVDNGLKTSMILFITSEVLFFFSFFWSYVHFFLSPTMETGMSWPPSMIEMFNCLNVPLINTMVLLSSGFFVTLSHHFMNKSLNKSMMSLLMSVVLGVFFTLLQLMEYSSSFFSISDSTFGTTFFMLTGFHGIHVLIGTLFLTVSLVRSIKLDSPTNGSINFEMAAWYWHFVDVVWIFLYFLIYYLNN